MLRKPSRAWRRVTPGCKQNFPMTLRIRDTNIAEGQHSSDHRPAGGFPKISQIEEKYVACMIAIESDDILQGGGDMKPTKGIPGAWGLPTLRVPHLLNSELSCPRGKRHGFSSKNVAIWSRDEMKLPLTVALENCIKLEGCGRLYGLGWDGPLAHVYIKTYTFKFSIG
jgi:hypothetical protein